MQRIPDENDLGPRKKFAETSAQNLLRDAGVVAIPVSLRQVIEHLQTVKNLEVVGSQEFTKKVSGFLIVCKEAEDEFVTIVFNEGHPWCRRRFTLAHELGHLLLGHGGCSKNEEDGSYNEKEANLFAGELLMPKKYLREDFVKTPNIPTLSKKYLVSGQALTIKLTTARLLKY